ncbi:MAG: peptide chain release factor N(5)-glutamine methyltransferase [Dehalococcoidia bacterium]
MTARHLLHAAAQRLLDAGCDDTLDEARLEVELLYGEAAGLDRARVLAAGALEPPPEAAARFEALLARRLGHEPLAYILGRRECYGLTFEVAPGVLIPRPDTETLIEAALEAVRAHPRVRRVVNVVDVGTGSGVIALAVAHHAPTAKVYALDASTEALAIAGRNRRRLGLTDRVVLLAGDLLEALPVPADVIVANLPYIPTAEVDRLAPEVRDWEPRAALDGGPDGLDVIRALIAQLPARLAKPGAVLLEVGHDQAPEVARLLEARLDAPARLHHDLAGIARVVEVRLGYD